MALEPDLIRMTKIEKSLCGVKMSLDGRVLDEGHKFVKEFAMEMQSGLGLQIKMAALAFSQFVTTPIGVDDVTKTRRVARL